ncbi:uncharacterized protein KY384_005574 [Bacidia gigantensis]|uniref:uncharacterized protein n=1 Tax=Bacidia gigantensis TaxID=2732470 RepID=UPI001D047E6D|nr:uncharacterized protein KY384_005574 [Bacidia gigantensis]KAG8530092.1 hypothetical protein KY384_005574 [Bacidia gigantensis]
MVSFWPWRGEDTSPASFEKALSSLSTKISKASSNLETLRQRSRRVNVLIYVVRLALTTYYDYRTSAVQAHLDDLERQRNKTIEKLKDATKYNSTQDLLKKYGGTPTPKEKPKKAESSGKPEQGRAQPQQGGRTNMAPPPTANIPHRIETSSPQVKHPQQQISSSPSASPQDARRPSSPNSPGADFAPNAFSAPAQYAQTIEGPKWYDRFMDALLGEDETLPSKRFALICSNCRLVNGQAPPGVSRLEDVGKWRCSGCGTMNGEEDEVRKLVKSIQQEPKAVHAKEIQHEERTEESKVQEAGTESSESDVTQYSTEEEKPPAVKETPRRRSTRPKKGMKSYDE